MEHLVRTFDDVLQKERRTVPSAGQEVGDFSPWFVKAHVCMAPADVDGIAGKGTSMWKSTSISSVPQNT